MVCLQIEQEPSVLPLRFVAHTAATETNANRPPMAISLDGESSVQYLFIRAIRLLCIKKTTNPTTTTAIIPPTRAQLLRTLRNAAVME